MSVLPPESHLLLVDGDDRVRKLLQQYLARHGYFVTAARDGAHAQRLMEGLDFDLILASDGTGAGELQAFLETVTESCETPVVALAAPAGEEAALRKAGAREVLQKPFEPAELVAVIDRVLDRCAPKQSAPPILRLGTITYEPQRGEMRRGALPVRLTASEMRLMRLLSECPGEPVSRARLAEAPEADNPAGQARAVDVQVTRLRRKVEPNPRSPRYILTVRGTGYMLAPD